MSRSFRVRDADPKVGGNPARSKRSSGHRGPLRKLREAGTETTDRPTPPREHKHKETGGPTDGPGGWDGERDKQARQYAEDTKAALGEVREGLEVLRGALHEQWEQIDRMIGRVAAQVAAVDGVLEAGPGQPPGPAFELVTGHQALVSDVEDAEESAQGNEQSVWDRIKRRLGDAGRKLWAMISRLVRVKEWSLTGTVGTGVFGLAEASISVTFG